MLSNRLRAKRIPEGFISKLQATFPRGIGQRGHAAVILVTSAIEVHPLDSGLLSPLGDDLADRLGGFAVAPVADLFPHVAVTRTGRYQSPAGTVI